MQCSAGFLLMIARANMKDFGSLTEIFSIQTTKTHTRSHSAEVGSLGDYLGGARGFTRRAQGTCTKQGQN